MTLWPLVSVIPEACCGETIFDPSKPGKCFAVRIAVFWQRDGLDTHTHMAAEQIVVERPTSKHHTTCLRFQGTCVNNCQKVLFESPKKKTEHEFEIFRIHHNLKRPKDSN